MPSIGFSVAKLCVLGHVGVVTIPLRPHQVGSHATNRNALTASKGRSDHSLCEISTTIPTIVRALALNSYELLSLKTASYRIRRSEHRLGTRMWSQRFAKEAARAPGRRLARHAIHSTIHPMNCSCSAVNFLIRYCALRLEPPTITKRASNCPRSAGKTGTYRSLRSFRWQHWCHRRA
jgi:hypothetical protein